MTTHIQQFVEDDFCYLTTTGWKTGRQHTIEIWFALDNGRLYMLAGSGLNAHWVRNIQANADVKVRIRDITWSGKGRIVDAPEEDALVRRVVVGKYQPRDSDDLTSWGRTALPVAIEIGEIVTTET